MLQNPFYLRMRVIVFPATLSQYGPENITAHKSGGSQLGPTCSMLPCFEAHDIIMKM